jgi:glyceraldehyde 3-phosphate dehydrogenase
MAVNIGINGFGRIGRLALRAAWDWPEVNFLHVNEVKGGPETAAHLLQFDSVHGKWERQIRPKPLIPILTAIDSPNVDKT